MPGSWTQGAKKHKKRENQATRGGVVQSKTHSLGGDRATESESRSGVGLSFVVVVRVRFRVRTSDYESDFQECEFTANAANHKARQHAPNTEHGAPLACGLEFTAASS
jgi:hypothetical protein